MSEDASHEPVSGDPQAAQAQDDEGQDQTSGADDLELDHEAASQARAGVGVRVGQEGVHEPLGC